VRSESPKLLAELNRFVQSQHALKGRDRWPSRAPGTNSTEKKTAQPAPVKKEPIKLHTPFDAAATEAGTKFGIEPGLLLAIAETASAFDSRAISSVGERGLLQIMAHIPALVGSPRADLNNPNENLAVGAQYLAMLQARFESSLPRRVRLQFALAAFKIGLGHVDDARRLAKEQLGLDPAKWQGAVARALTLLAQPQYAEQARNGYCRGADAVSFVDAVEKLLGATP
jgi:membrane-bound lytic murein transglycosylase F